MPGYSGALKKFREGGYSGGPSGEKPKEAESGESEDSGVRTIKLTDDEVKQLGSYATEVGQEQTCEITGKLEGNTFRVMSVRLPGGEGGGEEPSDVEQLMSKFRQGQAPVMQSQTIPSPS